MINEIQQQLTLIRDAWDASPVLPDEFTSLGFPGLTKVEVSDFLSGSIEILGELNQKDDFKPSLISAFNLQKTVATLSSYVSVNIPQSPGPHMPEALRLVELISNAIGGWLEESDKVSKRAATGLISKLAEATKKAEDAASIRDELQTYQAEMEARNIVAVDQANQIDDLLTNAKENASAIETNKSESRTALEQAGSDANEISIFTEEIATLKKDVNKAKDDMGYMFLKFEGHRDKITGLLGDANRAGMATSFKTRKDELQKPLAGWLVLFALSVFGLVVMGVIFFAPLLTGGTVLEGGKILPGVKWEELPIRLALVSPFIWLGWFAAKQFGYTARLREDYAFKEASAMSFEGYKREAGEVSPEMLEKLMEASIGNFSDNPVRIYSGTGNHASPLHELLDKSPDSKKLFEEFVAHVASHKRAAK